MYRGIEKMRFYEILKVFKECWAELQAEPTRKQFTHYLTKVNSPYTWKSFIHYFGNLGRLAQRIVDHQNGKISEQQLYAKHEKSYEKERIPPKLRYQVLERDGEKCVKCGRSPKTHGVTLHAHHKISEADGGPTTLENLVALCDDCHEGLHAQPKSIHG